MVVCSYTFLIFFDNWLKCYIISSLLRVCKIAPQFRLVSIKVKREALWPPFSLLRLDFILSWFAVSNISYE